jgi:Tol biopolymer transport system component
VSKAGGVSQHRGRLRPAALGLLLMAAASAAGAGQVELISQADPLPDSYGNSTGQALSADGRWIAFQSDALNLVPGQVDGNAFLDVFLADRLTGALTLVSHAAGKPTVAGHVAGTYFSLDTSISADGCYVAFTSLGTDLVPGVADTNQKSDLFLYDRVTGATTLVSHAGGDPNTPANGLSTEARISADGNWIVFASDAGNLVAGQVPSAATPPPFNLFLYHRPSGALTLLSHRSGAPATAGNGASLDPGISADGGFVVFTSTATDLVAGVTDAGAARDVFLYQRATGTVTLISHAAGAPLTAANALSSNPSLSADGRWVTFGSLAKNLIAGQTTAPGSQLNDLFLYDRISGSLRLLSHSTVSPQMGVGGGVAALSADGRYVAFDSPAPDLVPGQVNLGTGSNVFVYDRVTGKTSLVSHNRDSATTSPASPDSRQAYLSADGRYIAFASRSVDLVRGQIDTPNTLDVFVYDQSARTTVLASHVRGSLTTAGNATSTGPRISADGGVVTFGSFATDLAGGLADAQGFQDLFAFARRSAEVTALSRRAADLPATTPFGPSSSAGISADGRFVVFSSAATGLVPGQVDKPWWDDDPFSGRNGTWDVFLRDRSAGKTTLLSRSKASPPTAAGGDSPVISADGSAVAFRLPGGSSQVSSSLQLYDRATDTLRLVNHSPSPISEPSGAVRGFPVLSADGRFVAYTCDNCRLVPGQQNGAGGFSQTDVFLYDRTTGANTLLSHANGDPLTTGSRESSNPWISADGNVVAFNSVAGNLVPGQSSAEGTQHAFVLDRATGAVTLIDHTSGSPATATGHGGVDGMSADGRWIVFGSDAADLVSGQVDTNQMTDMFLYDRLSGAVSLISHASSSPLTAGNGLSFPFLQRHSALISADGRWTVFYSDATDLVAGVSDTNDGGDVFLYDRLSGTVSLVSFAAGSPSSTTSLWAQSPVISADGSRIGFQSPSPDLLPGQTGPAFGFYVQDRATGARTRLANTVGKAFNLNFNISFDLWMSGDGRQVAFSTDAPLVPGDFNANWDAFVYDAAAGPVTVPPCTLFDGVLRSNVRQTATAAGACGVPAGAKQAVLKLTVSQGTGKGNVQIYPGSVTNPSSGILRFNPGVTRSASFTVPLGNGGIALLPFVAGNGTVRVNMEIDGYVP